MNAEASKVIVVESAPRRERNDVAIPSMNDPTGVMALIAHASRDPNVDPGKMRELYEIRERELSRLAKQAFAAAMAEFKANPPRIVKDKHVEFTTGKGVTSYDHATLGHVCAAVIDGLSKVGVSHRWDLAQEGANVIVTCVLTHREGHETRTPFIAGRDDTGSKNNIQAVGSAITYAQRYTLLAAVGLAAGDDDDGRSSEDYVRISDSQAADLASLVEEVGANKVQLLAYLKLKTLGDIPAENFTHVVRLVESRRQRGGSRR